jgi:N-acetylmuramoyl-L-alanine amidase
MLFFVVFSLFAIGLQANTERERFILVIDPGHGGKDAGAIGKKGKEKNINLAVSKLLKQLVAEAHPDVKIISTREKDVFIGLDERANIANKANANLFISIHANSIGGKSKVRGAEVYTFGLSRTDENLEAAKRENSVILLEDDYQQKYEGFDPNSTESYIIFEFMQNKYVEQSINFASLVQKELVGTANRGDRGVRQAGFLVLRKSTMPRILIELDFISNPSSEDFMLSVAGQKTMARAICNAFTAYKKEFDRKSTSVFQRNQPEKQDDMADMTEITPDMTVPEKSTEIKTETTIDTETKAETETKIETETEAEIEIETEAKTTANANNIVYKVQILASVKQIPKNARELKGYKLSFYKENQWYKYTYGETSDWAEINNILKRVSKDFKNAFIVTFENGVKVPNK